MVISVIGLGFVGLTTALGLAKYGHTVYGIESDEKRLQTISSGLLPFQEPGLDIALKTYIDRNFYPTPSCDCYSALKESECIFYCVGTPTGQHGEVDLNPLFGAIDMTLKNITDNEYRVFVVKSSVPPSTCSSKLIPYIEERKRDFNYSLANNPEFLREGHCWEDFMNPGRIVIGANDDKAQGILKDVYSRQSAPLHFVSLNTAEYIKYLSNSVLACLISFSNEMAMCADKIGDIDVKRAFKILHEDSRWGNGGMASYFYPGCGYGGYCLPKDTKALLSLSESNGFDAAILREVISTNDKISEFTIDKIIKEVIENKSVKIGILGLSSKPATDDVRESPSAKIIAGLLARGYKDILGYDSLAAKAFDNSYPELRIRYCDTFSHILDEADVFIILSATEEFKDLASLTQKKIVDCRYLL
ncbi:MAG: UDP-glucose/GDP-mannose dehydrogenase family protein [Muribaculaceae bacterium]|nr:UDP-glucose/GDP-mannose dehydrogenase family protein [Muribaculaceae bacterium]